MVEDREHWELKLTETAEKLRVIQEKIDALERLKRAVIHQYEAALKEGRANAKSK